MDEDDMKIINRINTELNLASFDLEYLYKQSINIQDAKEYINMAITEIYEHKQKYLENKKGE